MSGLPSRVQVKLEWFKLELTRDGFTATEIMDLCRLLNDEANEAVMTLLRDMRGDSPRGLSLKELREFQHRLNTCPAPLQTSPFTRGSR